MNHAARQEIFRLPNGKLIQVRKQSGPPAPSPPRPGMPVATASRGPQFTIRQANAANARANFVPRLGPQIRQRFNIQPQTRFTFSEGRVVAQPVPPAPAPAPTPSASTIFTQQNGSISVARAPQPNTPFGTAKTEFEDKIISGMEICQHTINKMITLTNSTSFKTSGNFKDLKDLYIHLQYLFTYTSGKFNTLQESLKTGMESLAKHDDKLKDKADDDELEIVEEKQDVIEVMSDDDEPPLPAPKEKDKSPIAAPVKKPLLKHIQYTKDSETAEEKSEAAVNALKVIKDGSADKKILLDLGEMLEKDKKLSNRVMVKVEKLEDSKNPIIKQYMRQLNERLEKESSNGSREGTPDSIFEPMVCLEEDGEKKPETAVKLSEMENTETIPVENSPEVAEEAAKETESTDDVAEVPSEHGDAEEMNETLTAPEAIEAMDVDTEESQTKAMDESTGEDIIEDENVENINVEEEKIQKENIETNESSDEIETICLDDSLQDAIELETLLNSSIEAMETGEKSEEGEEKTGEKSEESEEKTKESEEKTEESKEKSEENQEKSEENLEKPEKIQESVEKTLEKASEVVEKSEDASVNIPIEHERAISIESSDTSQTCLNTTTEDIHPTESSHELPQASVDTVTENDFPDCPTNGSSLEAFDKTDISALSEKNGDDLPTNGEVAKLVENEIDDEKTMLENLFNELENKSTAMEVD